jgi:threonyl-tRNA synthetase
LRHSTAHATAQAVQELFPGTKIGQGPVIEGGFYYDFDRAEPFSDTDLAKIEERMREIVARNLPIERVELEKADAIAFFEREQEPYKIYFATTKGDARVSIYRQGGWTDFCRGPHLPSTGKLKAFKLLSTSNAYWKGDARNQPMQRVYGTAFFSDKELKAHLTQIEEAKKRDHRKLGRELGLFWFHPWAPGEPFWLPKGTTLVHLLANYMREVLFPAGYVEVRAPLVFNKALWETSGHWQHYRQNMFLLQAEDEAEQSGLKPMNCPGHMLLFGSEVRSYRDLPLRIHEQSVLHRMEASGVLSGLTRVREFIMDDAHIFLRDDQIGEEVERLLRLVRRVYDDFGLTPEMKLSTRPDEYLGEKATWDHAEAELKKALEAADVAYTINEGDGAFYGPKIDFAVTDALGRKWQCATIQLDYQLPQQFALKYIGADNTEHRPVVIHRAIFGSFERFIALLIEHYAGAFPLWIAPVQAIVLSIADRHLEYARAVRDQLATAGLRVEVDERQEKIGYKIREAQMQKIPYMLVVGDREAAEGTVGVRHRAGGDQGAQRTAQFIEAALGEVRSRQLVPPARQDQPVGG